MANPFGWIEGGLRWGGRRLHDIADEIIERRLYETGETVVQAARRLAPFRTGALRESIDYIVLHNEGGSRSELRIIIGMPYGIFQEFGTRNIHPHPFIRPALLEARRIWGFDLTVNFAGVGSGTSSGRVWHGLYATTGRAHRTANIVGPSRIQTLSAGQRLHIDRTLIPSIRQFHRGNVRRVRFTVGNQ